MIVQPKSELVEGTLLLLVAFLLVNAPNCHLSFVLASVVQGDAVNCNTALRLGVEAADKQTSDLFLKAPRQARSQVSMFSGAQYTFRGQDF